MSLCIVTLQCACSLTRIPRVDLQWPAFAKFALIKKAVVIPINPPIDAYPGWHLGPVPLKAEHIMPSKRWNVAFNPGALIARSNILKADYVPIAGLPGPPDILVYLDSSLCIDAFLGVEMDLAQGEPGRIRISWSKGRSFDEANSLTRFYPGAESQAQFAFHRSSGEDILHIVQMGDAQSRITAVRVYGLGGD